MTFWQECGVWALAAGAAYGIVATSAVVIPRLLPKWFYNWMGDTLG